MYSMGLLRALVIIWGSRKDKFSHNTYLQILSHKILNVKIRQKTIWCPNYSRRWRLSIFDRLSRNNCWIVIGSHDWVILSYCVVCRILYETVGCLGLIRYSIWYWWEIMTTRYAYISEFIFRNLLCFLIRCLIP